MTFMCSHSSYAVFDVNCDGQEGIAEAIHALQVASGDTPYTPYCETVTSKTGRVWMDRNLGASRVATSATDPEAYGDLYQWGRGTDGHEKRNSPTTSTLSTTDTPDPAGSFITTISSPYDWRTPQNPHLWQEVSGINNPCPDGFRLPTDLELNEEMISWGDNNQNSTGAYNSELKLVVAGYRSSNGGTVLTAGSDGNYWSGTVNSTYSRFLYVDSGNALMLSYTRAGGFSVRCIKD